MTLNCVVFDKNQIYRPLSFVRKLSSDFDLEDLYLNINQCILILIKNYTI